MGVVKATWVWLFGLSAFDVLKGNHKENQHFVEGHTSKQTTI